jgi:translation initiation factor IF-2
MTEWATRQARRAAASGNRPALPFSPAPRAALAARPAPAPARALPGQRRGPQRAPVSGAGVRRPPRAPIQAHAPVIPTAERRADKRVVKVEGSTRVSTLAASMGVKAVDVLRRLLALGAKGVHVNSTLDVDTAALVAAEFGWSVENLAVSDAERVSRARAGTAAGERQRRAPVVTVMGHVDHGKTSLLDRIRQTRVAEAEAGGITQHIGAYVAETPRGRLTFIDTPGHAAFGALRARGARVTDVVVLVVAADDGLMPQTREAIAHAREAGVPIVVAINKMDVPGADAARVRRELSEAGLVPEAWGGDTLVAEVSARTGAGIDALLDAVLLQADLLGLAASPEGAGSGVVLEARLDKGRGPLATVLVKEGTLRVRDTLLVGDTFGKVRALQDERGRPMDQAGPSTPVVVVGLEALPRPGDAAVVVKDVAAARQITLARHSSDRAARVAPLAKATIGDLAHALGPRAPELCFVVKADTDGSTEALKSVLAGLSRPELLVDVVHAGVGAVTESDVQLAAAAGALILGFEVDVVGRARTLARQLGVETREYRLIYELGDDVARLIARRLAPPTVESEIGRAEVRQVFAAGTSRAAGCRVLTGVMRRNARVRLERAGNVLWQGGVASLRRFREDVREVAEGMECGVVLAGFSELEVGDILVATEMAQPAGAARLQPALAS